ncbi:GNAT family N-acetyltransferase [Cellulomonas sp. PhB150]|uniref:GNAT family N-acetyltransferase n=1 Tax=Cellulomonas sp. PhB150 TaxID=2485188 RepID=UPI000F492448|nr:GNAT family N-acetyltransferase [Cellulomonas sp. PhB150]ROS31146.1 acetyltransferase (GNAT) family protein [Cellulomonas sp. PhB150]
MDDEVRDACQDDVPAIRTVLARAYDANPLIRWVFPDDATRAGSTAAWLGPSIEQYLAVGVVHVALAGSAVVGVAAWRPAGAASAPAGRPAPADVLRGLVGPTRAAEVLEVLAGTRELAPSTTAAYLNYFAVDPPHQGRGHGARLLGAAPEGDAWLGTTDPTNVPFYERLGYRTFASRPLGDGPTLTLMARSGQDGSANQTTVSP